MPDQGPRLARWMLLGRLLPREARERIFEPAMSDLFREWARRPREARGRFAPRALVTAVTCLTIGLPTHLYAHGRVTRTGRIAAWVTVTLITVGLIVANMAQAYAAAGR